jgi:hypothetical protein
MMEGPVDRAPQLLRIITAELKSMHAQAKPPKTIHDKDVADLAKTQAKTFSAWSTGRSPNHQLTALLALLDYFPLEKIPDVFRTTHKFKSLSRVRKKS